MKFVRSASGTWHVAGPPYGRTQRITDCERIVVVSAEAEDQAEIRRRIRSYSKWCSQCHWEDV